MSNAGAQTAISVPDAQEWVQAPFGLALTELARQHDDVVGLTADLGKYTDIIPFAEAFPDRYFNVGMAEQNLIAMSAGLAKVGKTPFATTYGVFASRRAYEFVSVLCAHSNLNVKIFGAMPGITTSYGASHQAIEDAGLMKLIPGLTVIDPCDATEIAQVVHAAYEIPGPVYVRLQRGKIAKSLPAHYRFKPGKAQVVRQGKDIGIISTGSMTAHALEAAAIVAEEGISVTILHAPSVKPFDTEAVVDFAKTVPQLVSFENHVIRGGLGSQVAETLFDAGVIVPLRRIALPDKFIEVGSPAYLMQKYELSVQSVVSTLRHLAKA